MTTRILLLAAAVLGILWLASRAHDEPVADTGWRDLERVDWA